MVNTAWYVLYGLEYLVYGIDSWRSMIILMAYTVCRILCGLEYMVHGIDSWRSMVAIVLFTVWYILYGIRYRLLEVHGSYHAIYCMYGTYCRARYSEMFKSV